MILTNPTSGRRRGLRIAETALAELRDAGMAVRGLVGADAADALRLARGCVDVAAPGIVAYADGERIGPLPQTVEVVPQALKVLVP